MTARLVVRSGQGRLHVATELPGVGYLGVCRSLIVRPSSVEPLTADQATRLHAAAPGAVCHYCALIAAEVERALEVADLEQAVQL